MPNADGSAVEKATAKSKPAKPPEGLTTQFPNIAKFTKARCKELQRMTDYEMCYASARAKAKSRAKKIILDRDADVPHDSIIEEEDTLKQWLNRYSGTSLRWPMFDCTSLLSWVWGLPMVVPNEELGACFEMFYISLLLLRSGWGLSSCVLRTERRSHLGGVCLAVD